MTVIRPNSVSGITSITAQANEINFFRSNGTLAGLQLNGVNFNTTTGVSTFNNLNVGGVLTYQDVTNVDSVGIITARSTIDAQGDVSIADKIIHTGDTNTAIRFPSADTITFETAGSERVRITSDGFIQYAPSNMQIFADTSDGSDDHYLNLSGGGACAQTRGAQVVMYGNEKSNEQGRLLLMAGNSGNTNGSIDFYSGGSKKATITASGNFGVGTNNPTSKIDIHCGSDNTAMQITSTDAGAYLTAIDNTGAGSFGHQGTDTVITCDAGGSVANSAISFQIDYNVERMRIQNNGNVTISDGDLVIGTNGHGIDFSAAGNVGGMTSELFDDYEEGTWVPDARDGSLSYERANYTKIGRMVYLSAYVYNFSDNSTNDSVTIQSLPFTPSVISVAVGSVMYNFVSDTDNTTVYMASTGLVFYGGVSGGYDQVRYNELNGNSSFYFQAAYFAS